MQRFKLLSLILLLCALAGCGTGAPTDAPTLEPLSSPATAVATDITPTAQTPPASPESYPAPDSSEIVLPPPIADYPGPEMTSPPPLATPAVTFNPITFQFDGAQAMTYAEAQCAIGPRPTGSEALLQTRDYIESVLIEYGWEIVRQDGEFMGVPIHNVIAIKGEGPPLMVGAHYDSRPAADRDLNNPTAPIIGGNDGASGVAVLLELARVLEVPEGRQVQLAFFDAEDRGNLEGWPFSVGARLVAEEMPIDRPDAMVVVDMIGDADQQIFREQNSNQQLNDVIFGLAASLGMVGEPQGFINTVKYSITDDHIPFIEQGIPAIDLIDFDYPYWHTTEDTCDKLGAESLARVGIVMEAWLEAPITE